MPSIRVIGAALAVAVNSHVVNSLAQDAPSKVATPASAVPLIERLTVTASPLPRDVLEMAQPATVLGGDALRRARAADDRRYAGRGAGRVILVLRSRRRTADHPGP